ncbi:Two-component response regulator [Rhodovulum sp. P5]|uniref:response regulator transcription factor n=1 Tax=Rhodovulum sp. P5 TaxID=1564506 RepID=UPI0009C1AEE6|nr:response regulator [Rhodovulum sp. P5]ARE42096.1 Two-component response regulator [Rhodovulum sp. P5]
MARILIADDDADYRTAFCSGLDALGHKAVGVAQTDQVEPALVAGDPPYDIVFLDVMMPNGSTAALLQRLSESQPDLPVVMITGRPELTRSPLFKNGMRLADARVGKTATLRELDDLVRSLTGD